MKRNLLNVLKAVTVSLLMLGLAGGAAAQGPGPQSVQTALGTGFTYQGQLKNNNGPVTSTCDFQFSLWDSLSNTSGQIGTTQTKASVSVVAGLFTIPNLDFGSGAFTGDARWLQIAVKCAGDSSFNTLSPRQALTAAPYALTALSLRPGAVVSGTVQRAALTGQQGGISGELGYKYCTPMSLCYNYGVRGIDTSPSGISVGVYGKSISGTGVFAEATGEQYGIGVRARAFGSNGTGIYSEATGAGGTGVDSFGKQYGVKGTTDGANGYGVYAEATGTSGTGIYGKSTTGVGIYATSNGAGGNGAALRATNTNANGIAIWGTAKGTDSTMVLEHDGTARGDFIRAFRTTPTNALVFRVSREGDVYAAGQTTTAILQITGGSDLAEKFDVAGKSVEPGTLMIIDEEHPGKLKPSQTAYDTKVAGVVSGAGGVQPGLTLQQQGVMEGNTSIAIAGRVYVRGEALSAPIEPGDLLTSSNLPGFAMKATDKDKSYGAIIGKAMTGLNEGTGLVLVLVNLQ